MDTKQRQRLEEIISYIETWNEDNLNSLFHFFMVLKDYDFTEVPELKERLRKAIKNNPFFDKNDSRIVQFLGASYKPEDGYFWYDLENW